MLQITISDKYKLEKEYIISVLLSDFLGIDYNVIIDENQSNYQIKYINKTIEIKDDFFNRVEKQYIKRKNIPGEINFSKQNTPIIFGDNFYSESEEGIELGLDLFASSFFMLTRWEEIVLKDKDPHGRSKVTSSLAYKNGFHRKPVVNEYLELLWQCLLKIGFPESSRKKRNFIYQYSHDVDHPQLFPNTSAFLRQSGFQLFKKGNFKQPLNFTKSYLTSKKDPYDTFDFLMNVSEANNCKSQFNFMNCAKSKFDEGYSINNKFIKKLVNKIKDRGHRIGFHPSYNSFNQPELWKKEKEGLENILDQKITAGRQHYLRFENPSTWNIWESNGMLEDSTMGYADEVGFRAGTCYSYHPFDVINKKKLRMLETPLVLMEGALINGLKTTPDEFKTISEQLKNEVKKYNGVLSILWHNSSFFLEPYPDYEVILSKL